MEPLLTVDLDAVGNHKKARTIWSALLKNEIKLA
jgi:hypothetical protein